MRLYSDLKKTCGGYTAEQLIDMAEIIETKSQDFYFRAGDYDLLETEDCYLAVNSVGGYICVMDVDDKSYSKLIQKMAEIEALYQKRAIER